MCMNQINNNNWSHYVLANICKIIGTTILNGPLNN